MNNDYVLVISNGYPCGKKTGGIFAYQQTKALQALGQKMIFLGYDLNFNEDISKLGLQSFFSKDNIKIYTINKKLKLPQKMRQFLCYHYIKMAFKKIIEENGLPKLIHAHFALSGYFAAKLKKKYKIPLVITEHSTNYNFDKISPIIKYFGGYGHKHADAVIAVSKSLQKNIKKHSGIDAALIYNMVDTKNFKLTLRTETSKFIFISVGFLIKRKGHDSLIKAFYEAFKEIDNVFLNIIGDGAERENLEKLILELNLESKVKLLGHCSKDIIENELSQANCFALASHRENFGVVYIEAMATGLPVIATRCGGPEDFVNENNGILVDVDNIEQLIKAMVTMRKTAQNYDGKAISKNTIDNFSEENIAKQILCLYDQTLKK